MFFGHIHGILIHGSGVPLDMQEGGSGAPGTAVAGLGSGKQVDRALLEVDWFKAAGYDKTPRVLRIACQPMKRGAPPACILADEVRPLAVVVLPRPGKSAAGQGRHVRVPLNNDFRFMLCAGLSAPPGL